MDVGKGREQDAEALLNGFLVLWFRHKVKQQVKKIKF